MTNYKPQIIVDIYSAIDSKYYIDIFINNQILTTEIKTKKEMNNMKDSFERAIKTIDFILEHEEVQNDFR